MAAVRNQGAEGPGGRIPYVGIDFGTSKSAVAWHNPKTQQAEILKNAEEQDATPSAVYFGADETLVGQGALNILEDAADDGNLEMAGRVWINVKRDLAGGTPRLIGERVVQPKDVATAIFAKLKRDAEEYHFHQPVLHAVVTCPASCDVVQRDKIKEAARAAGFEEVALLDEPVAAAMAYAEAGLQVGSRVPVYDLGGGTFDLAVLARDSENGSFRVALPPAGLSDCGGNAFDLALYEYCRQCVAEIAGDERTSSTRAGAPLSLPFLQRCRKCKEALSSKEAAVVSTLVPVNGRLQRFREAVTRATFEELIADKVEATVRLTAAVERQVREAGAPVDTVVLVGSASRVPLVDRLLRESLPVAPLRWQKQGGAVALGAACHAHRLREDAKPVWLETLDVVMPQLPAREPGGIIRRWVKRDGDPVNAGETLVEVETDQVQAGIGAPARGVVEQLVTVEGASVPFGHAIISIWRETRARTAISFTQVQDERVAYTLGSPMRMSPTESLFVAALWRSIYRSELLVYRLPDVRQRGGLEFCKEKEMVGRARAKRSGPPPVRYGTRQRSTASRLRPTFSPRPKTLRRTLRQIGALMEGPFTETGITCAFSSDGRLVARGGPSGTFPPEEGLPCSSRAGSATQAIASDAWPSALEIGSSPAPWTTAC